MNKNHIGEKTQYIEVIAGDYYGARGYVIEQQTANSFKCKLFYLEGEVTKNLNRKEIKFL